MPTFEQYETAIVAGLKGVSGVRDVTEYAFDLSPAALKKIAPRGDGVLFVPLGGKPSNEQPSTGQFAFECRNAAFIITRNARGAAARGQSARVIARNIMLLIHQQQWGLNDVFPAVVERLENRSAAQVDNEGYAIWLVLWKQLIYADDAVIAPDLAPATLLIGKAPNIGDGHAADYRHV
jgi:hypothetical protein